MSKRYLRQVRAADELYSSYEEAMRDAAEEGAAIVAEAVRKAEARRRIQVDLQGCAVVTYVDAGEEERP
jgi:hypothetical protein